MLGPAGVGCAGLTDSCAWTGGCRSSGGTTFTAAGFGSPDTGGIVTDVDVGGGGDVHKVLGSSGISDNEASLDCNGSPDPDSSGRFITCR